MATKKIKSRKFLNKQEGLAAIEVRFEFDSMPFYGGWDAHVTISDCNRSVNLDFCAYSEKNVDDVINKAQILIDEITKLQAAMIENRDVCINKIKEADKKRKERIKKREAKPFNEILEGLNDDK